MNLRKQLSKLEKRRDKLLEKKDTLTVAGRSELLLLNGNISRIKATISRVSR